MNSCNPQGTLGTFISLFDNPTANKSKRVARAIMTRTELKPYPHRAAKGQGGTALASGFSSLSPAS